MQGSNTKGLSGSGGGKWKQMRERIMRKIEKLVLTATVVLGTVIVGHAQDEMSPASSWNPEKRQQWREVLAEYDYIAIAKAYADYMIEHGRDVYGKEHTPLFVTGMDRQ
jgi:hypothetical protein